MKLITGIFLIFFSFYLCADNINQIINAIPEIPYTLYTKSSWPSRDGEYHERENGIYPISDRTIDALTVYFKKYDESVIIASWDMHDMHLPLSTLFGNKWHLRGYYLAKSNEIFMHDVIAAKYIVSMFKAGANIMMLKGVPDDREQRFDLFCDILDGYAKESGINLDIELLKKTRYIDERGFIPSSGLICIVGDCVQSNPLNSYQRLGIRYQVTTRLGNRLTLINAYYEDHNAMQSLKTSKNELKSSHTVVIFGTGRFYYSNNPADDARLALIKTLPGIAHGVLQNKNQQPPTNNLPPEDLTFLLSNHIKNIRYHNKLKNMANSNID